MKAGVYLSAMSRYRCIMMIFDAIRSNDTHRRSCGFLFAGGKYKGLYLPPANPCLRLSFRTIRIENHHQASVWVG
jgi:hypothetical protein